MVTWQVSERAFKEAGRLAAEVKAVAAEEARLTVRPPPPPCPHPPPPHHTTSHSHGTTSPPHHPAPCVWQEEEGVLQSAVDASGVAVTVLSAACDDAEVEPRPTWHPRMPRLGWPLLVTSPCARDHPLLAPAYLLLAYLS